MNYFIRPATPDDINKIIEFTTQEAQESEGSVIDLVAVERGVSSGSVKTLVQNIGSWKILQER